jgi:hypothetical protein
VLLSEIKEQKLVVLEAEYAGGHYIAFAFVGDKDSIGAPGSAVVLGGSHCQVGGGMVSRTSGEA